MSGLVYEAPPMSRKDLRRVADVIRVLAKEKLKVVGPPFPIVYVVEKLLLKLDPDFCLEICGEDEMAGDHGLAIPSEHLIRLREDVYDGACAGKGRDRLTVAHELGHYILHDDRKLTRRMPERELKPYKSAEWQAKAFSGELLVAAQYLTGISDAGLVAGICGVSDEAGVYQFEKLKDDGLI